MNDNDTSQHQPRKGKTETSSPRIDITNSEKQIKQTFNSILDMEYSSVSNNDEFDNSSFSNVPMIFNGLCTSTFGYSSSFQTNPFFEIKNIAMDTLKSWDDRTQAVRYMQKIPHIQRDVHCVQAAISIITDKQYDFENRFNFFANNEKFIKMDYVIVNACHKYVYENFDSLSDAKIPILYKILSSQYILTQFPVNTYDLDSVQNYLLSIAKDTSMEINYRAECADILDRTGYGSYKTLGREIIDELGDLYNENKKKTIYTNLQNVHDDTVTKKIVETLRYLMLHISTERNSSEVYEYIVDNSDRERLKKITKSFQRIVIDTARYEGLPLIDILLLVWEKICSSSSSDELKKRLLDELYDMDETCSTGHLSRIINVLSGFFDDIQPVKISFKDQLRSNVFARYSFAMKTLTRYEQDTILNEMTSDYKPTIEDFILSYSPRDELMEEFVPDYLSMEDFEECYEHSEKEFFGMN